MVFSVLSTQKTHFVAVGCFFSVKNVVSTHLDLRFSDVYQVFEATRLGGPPETNIKTAGFVVWEWGRGD